MLENASNDDIFIVKPVASCIVFFQLILGKGNGVKLINKKSKLPSRKGLILSEYIKNPHLINELKYDLRLYVLVTSYDPIKIYIYEEGLCRFAT